MAITRTRFHSNCLGGFVSFMAVIPFEDYGHFMNPNPHPFDIKAPLRTLYLLHGITGDENDWMYGTQIEKYAIDNHIAVIMPDGTIISMWTTIQWTGGGSLSAESLWR